MNDAEREAFETWAASRYGKGMLTRAANGPYVWDSVDSAWRVWQARASLSLPSSGDGRDAEPDCEHCYGTGLATLAEGAGA